MEFHEVRVSVSDFRFEHSLQERKTTSISISDFRLQLSCSSACVRKRVNFKLQHLSFNFRTEVLIPQAETVNTFFRFLRILGPGILDTLPPPVWHVTPF